MAEPTIASPGAGVRYAQAVVHAVAAALLGTAALLKAYQLVAGPAEALTIGTRVLELGLIELELILAGMLLLGMMPFVARYLALLAFTVFALISLRKAIGGSSSCGCFGPVDVNPRITAGIDLLMVVLLSVIGPPRPQRDPRLSRAGWLRWRRFAVVTFVILMSGAAGAAVFAAAPKRGLVVTGGAVHDFGIVGPDKASRCEHAFIVRNTSSRPVRVTGFLSSCGCTVAELPTSPIAPGGVADVRVRADWTGVVGKPYARVTLQTNSFWTPRVLLTIHAEIAPAPARAPATEAGLKPAPLR
jgi:hypothetical protein